MSDAIAVLNAGSSSIKFSLFVLRAQELELELRGQIEGIYTAPHFVATDRSGKLQAEKSWGEGVKLGHAGALDHLVAYVRRALGGRPPGRRRPSRRAWRPRIHRSRCAWMPTCCRRWRNSSRSPRCISRTTLRRSACCWSVLPALPQVACFDTSFHRSNPEIAQMFALPAELHAQGVRRYGFHGLSYEYIASVLPGFDAKAAGGRTVVLHLGNGASMCAIQAGKSVASTMGFTAVEGLPMGTRCGSVDPGVMLYLMDQRGMDARAIEKLIYNQSGLLGVSGISSDMRTLLASEDPRAQARDRPVRLPHSARAGLARRGAGRAGCDRVHRRHRRARGRHPRARVPRRGLARRGARRRRECKGGPRISAPASRVSAWVIPTNEELMIARHTRALLAG